MLLAAEAMPVEASAPPTRTPVVASAVPATRVRILVLLVMDPFGAALGGQR